jgi:GalNAc-alpha-(1->4)-GalNAc-alpha-(1->3)-diNAcBac-PP-undecaprenol alpha-1,4-N-acetyl-D-galactosaminyltransferase
VKGRSQPSVLLVIGSLGSGGAERVLVGIAGQLAARGNRTTVLTASQPQDDFYELSPAVHRRSPTRAKKKILKILHFQKALIAASLKTDVIVSFITATNVAACITGLVLRKPVVVSERIHPEFNQGGSHRWLFMAALQLYKLPNVHLVVQSKGIAEPFRDAGVDALVIPNGVAVPDDVASWETRTNSIIVVGSLSPRKRVSDVFHAWAASGLSSAGWRIKVVGDGPLKADLEALASSLNIANSVEFLGLTRGVGHLLQVSKIYVSCSAYEGTSNALLEAMAGGCACVVSDCPGDNRELILHGQGVAFPVGDVQALTSLLKWLAADDHAAARLGSTAHVAATKRDWGASLQAWCDLIEATSPKGAGAFG